MRERIKKKSKIDLFITISSTHFYSYFYSMDSKSTFVSDDHHAHFGERGEIPSIKFYSCSF